MDIVQKIAEFPSTLSCDLFKAATVYINFVKHPARMECGTEIAATDLVPTYRRVLEKRGRSGHSTRARCAEFFQATQSPPPERRHQTQVRLRFLTARAAKSKISATCACSSDG